MYAQRKKGGGPRAVAVLAWNGDSPKPNPNTSVLTPVTILVEGRYYDANLYQAQPEPLAVDPGVMYDVLQNGDPIGTFTVGGTRNKDSVWYGTGQFEPKGALTVQMTKSGATKSISGETASKSPAADSATDDRPRLRHGTPPPPPPKAQTDAVLSSIDRDPERPALRRHTAEERKAEAQTKTPPADFVPPQVHVLAAVSDASAPEPRSFSFRAKSGELDELRAAMEKMVQAELSKIRKPQPALKNQGGTGKTQRLHGPTPSAPLALTSVKFGVFDVNINNAPVLVYSATAVVDGERKYVTVAAWEEIDQSLRKIFSQITDDQHLDVYPRLEVIDAVDADGNGRGELLFRAFGDNGSRFVLYHPGPDSLTVLFDSARAAS